MPTAKEPSRLGSRQFQKPQLRSPRISFALALCCIFFVFAVYSRSLDFQFVLDDHRFTAEPRIQESGHIWDYFANFVWAQFTGGPPSFYRPVFLLWMRINFVLSGLSPWGWHLLSIAKHVAVAALLGMLVWKLLQDSTSALVTATLFALHPAQTESVSWVTVPDPLMSAGLLGSLLCYLRYLDGDSRSAVQTSRRKSRKTSDGRTPPRSIAWLAASLAAYFGALLTKETAIIFPAVIIAVDLCAKPSLDLPKGRAQDANASISFSGLSRHVAPFLCVTVLYLGMRFNALGSTLDVATQHLSWSTLTLSWPAILWFYLKVLLWPVRSYSFADPTLVDAFSLRGVLLPLLGLVCAALMLSGTVFWGWTKARRDLDQQEARGVEIALAAGTLLIVLPLLLTLNLNALNPDDFLHGRYTYLPLAGLMLLVSTFFRIAGKLRPFLLVTGGVLAIAFAALTFVQEKEWKDDATLFTIAHELAPRNGPVARNLADTHVQAALKLDEEGRCSEALPVFEKVTSDYPQDWYAWAGLGDCYVQLNDLVKAEESEHRAADISHDSRVIAHWQELRAHMGLPSSVPAN
jgi:tetratricopeptide (TPR) repeat protein